MQPDLVLVDVVMPGKSGYEVCQTLKSDPATQHIPVLLLAGTLMSPLRRRTTIARIPEI